MRLISPAFAEGESIPDLYTIEGENTSPPFEISGVPDGAESLALVMEDPDVPRYLLASGMFDHWTVFNLPPDIEILEAAAEPPGVVGLNTYGRSDYAGPAPPDGEHRYHFYLYALDCRIDLAAGSTKDDLYEAMTGHVIEVARLIGLYERYE